MDGIALKIAIYLDLSCKEIQIYLLVKEASPSFAHRHVADLKMTQDEFLNVCNQTD